MGAGIFRVQQALTIHQVWINHKFYNGWAEEEPFWQGEAYDELKAANLALDTFFVWACERGWFDPLEPVVVKVFQPYTKKKPVHYSVRIKVAYIVSEISGVADGPQEHQANEA